MAECEVVEFGHEHINAVVVLGQQLQQASPLYKMFEYPPEIVYRWLEFFADEETAQGWVTLYEGEVVGMLHAVLYSKPFLMGVMACDEFLYMDPRYRSSGGAEAMVEEYVDWAKSHHAQAILLCNTAGIEIDRAQALYEKCGFKLIGTNTMYEGD